jgi:hypothetical protein
MLCFTADQICHLSAGRVLLHSRQKSCKPVRFLRRAVIQIKREDMKAI